MYETKLLRPDAAFEYRKLTLKKYQSILFTCDKDNIAAAGAASETGEPLGLALAVRLNDSDSWTLCSIFVIESARSQGLGMKLWRTLSEELKARGAKRILFQAVLREEPEKALTGFFVKAGFQKPERIAKIFSYSGEGALRSSFVRASREGAIQSDGRFQMVSPKELSREAIEEMQKNEGGWYPRFVSPFIGWDYISSECSVFAVDKETGKTAAWLTAMNVNDDTYILYRTFFTREEYRDTAVGLHIFSEAVRRHYAFCPEKKALASVPMDNERSMRFNELFFRGAHDHVSYEISAEYFL